MRALILELEHLCIDNPTEAVSLAEEAMSHAAVEDLPRLCSVSGAAYRRLAELDLAYQALFRGLEVAEELDDFNVQAELLQRIACVCGDRGHYERAIATSERAALKFLRAGNLSGSGRSLFDVGMWHYYLEDYEGAVRICRSAYRILPEQETNHRFAALQCIALSYLELEDVRKARHFAHLAKLFEGRVADSMWAKLLWLEAKLLSKAGAFDQAEGTLQQALDLFLRTDAYLDVALACVEITRIVLRSGEVGRARSVASSCGKLLVANPRLGSNPLAEAVIMDLVRCGVTGGDLETLLEQIAKRLEQAEACPRQLR